MNRELFLALIRKAPWFIKAAILCAIICVAVWLFAILIPVFFSDVYVSLVFAVVLCVVIVVLYVVVGLCILAWLFYLVLYDIVILKTPEIARKGMDVGVKTVGAGYGVYKKGMKRFNVRS